jgi:hypothetical protein
MRDLRRQTVGTASALACALVGARIVGATGVPIDGYLPLVGIALTNEYLDDFTPNPVDSPSLPMGVTILGPTGSPFYDVALLDTGAGFSALTAETHIDFNMNGPYDDEPDGGFEGTEFIQFGGATGTLTADIDDPLGLYAGGLQARTGTAPLTLDHSLLRGQTNTSLITVPASSDLPNILGLPYISRYATYIRSDMPQFFSLNGQTVRTPSIEFLSLGSGGQGIARRAPLTLNPGSSFTGAPLWLYNLINFDIDNPQENPSSPTLLAAGTGGAFLTVNATDAGVSLGNTEFLFDSGASVTVLSEFSAHLLGFDAGFSEPEFTVSVVGSGGTAFDVPGFFIDELLIQAIGGNVVLNNVPVIVFEVTNPGDIGNVVPGIIGTNVLSGRNIVFDPKPSVGGGGVGPSLYISDPITTEKNWTASAASGIWSAGGNWSGGTEPDTMSITNVRHVSGGNQTAVLAADTTVWEVNVSGTVSQTMTLQVQSGVKLTTFSGINIEQGGIVELQNGTLDAQFVEVSGGTLRGAGAIATGSGPIPGQVENRSGTVAPGNGVGTLNIEGRFANLAAGTLAMELGGTAAGTQYDQLVVDGDVVVVGTLSVSLVDLGGGTFAPTVGNSFTLIDIIGTGEVGGTFANFSLPAGYTWNIAYNLDNVVLSVTGIGTPGDFNGDGKVDGADYVVWRKMNGSPQQYQDWRANFGAGTGAGSSALGSDDAGAVPEPAGVLLLTVVACGLAKSRRRITRPARS